MTKPSGVDSGATLGRTAPPAGPADRHVFCTEQKRRIGHLVHPPPGDTGDALLVSRGWWNRRVRRVPRDAISSSGADGVRTRLSLGEFMDLPGYVPDADLLLRVREQLATFLRLRRCGLDSVDMRVSEGHVVLTGFVATTGFRRAAIELAAKTWGVLSVADHLVTDSELESKVALAFVAYPELQPSLVRVSASLGTVLLEGDLETQDLVDLACTLAGNQPGVTVASRLIALH